MKILLFGVSNVGKTTTGKLLAERLGFDFRDLDEPFNPKDVDIVFQPMVISNIINQLKYGGIIRMKRL